MDDMKILAVRRAYEFAQDDLRLTVLSVVQVAEHIKQAFGFQGYAFGTPIPTFGDVPATLPPGIVFYSGVWLSPDHQVSPIRLMNFEPRRIVIDVTSSSSAIDGVFSRLQDTLGEIRAPDGAPAIGTPRRIRDYSEVSAHFRFPLKDLLASPIQRALERATETARMEKPLLQPTIFCEVVDPKEEYAGLSAVTSKSFQFGIRTGTPPEENVYFSAAPLDLASHMAFLESIEESFVPSPAG